MSSREHLAVKGQDIVQNATRMYHVGDAAYVHLMLIVVHSSFNRDRMACMNLHSWVATVGLYGLPPPALAHYDDEPSRFAPAATKLQAVTRATGFQKALQPIRQLLGGPDRFGDRRV